MKISVITATYNSQNYIAECISSVNEQNHQDIEHIIIDGVSRDNTKAIIHQMDNRVTIFISEPDSGIYDALNKGIQLATGEIIGFLHSDDTFAESNTLEHVNKAFVNGADIVYGNMTYVKKNNPSEIVRKWVSKPYDFKNLKYGWMPPHTTFFCRRSVYDKHGLFDLKFKISADYDIMMRILKDNTLNVQYLPIPIMRMRLGGASNRNLRNVLIKMKEDYCAIRKNKIGGLYTLLFKNLRKLPQFITK